MEEAYDYDLVVARRKRTLAYDLDEDQEVEMAALGAEARAALLGRRGDPEGARRLSLRARPTLCAVALPGPRPSPPRPARRGPPWSMSP